VNLSNDHPTNAKIKCTQLYLYYPLTITRHDALVQDSFISTYNEKAVCAASFICLNFKCILIS
jgi:hypothetical protein